MVGVFEYKLHRVSIHTLDLNLDLRSLLKDRWRIVSIVPDVNLDYYLVTLERESSWARRG